ncbi:hypothetical protein BS78_03G205400 [Paspalum vaginatum]|nr:hypothetical protein BS78_03G205400 [Paspalum vaginatum]
MSWPRSQSSGTAGRGASAALECAMCLAEFTPRERLQQLPSCSHALHIDCIDTWLHADDLEASCRDLHLADGARISNAARVGSCRFPPAARPMAAAVSPTPRARAVPLRPSGLSAAASPSSWSRKLRHAEVVEPDAVVLPAPAPAPSHRRRRVDDHRVPLHPLLGSPQAR